MIEHHDGGETIIDNGVLVHDKCHPKEQQRPVLIDVPFGEMPIPRAPQIAFVYNLPWTQPQEGLISS